MNIILPVPIIDMPKQFLNLTQITSTSQKYFINGFHFHFHDHILKFRGYFMTFFSSATKSQFITFQGLRS